MSGAATARLDRGPRSLPEGWRWVRLGEVCASRVETCDPSVKPDHPFAYVDITSIDSRRKVIVEPKILRGRDAPSRARQRIRCRDVIVSTTRPNLNAVAMIPPELDRAVCSTGFCVLRPKESLDPHYLFAFVQSWGFVHSLSELVKGALYPAVTDRQVLSQTVPLPPVPEQRRTAATLREHMASIDQAGAAAEGQLEAAKALPAAYLRQAFQGPEARSWRKTRLGDICEIQLGKMLSPKSRGGYRPRPYLRNANVQWDRFDLSDVSEMDFSDREEQKFALRSGDLIVCEGGEPGRAAVWEGRIRPCYYQKALHRLRPVGNCVDPRFLMYRLWFGATRAEFAQSNAKTTIAHLPAVCSASAGSGESVQPLR